MRRVKEWIGKTDDSDPTEECKARIVKRQHGRCIDCGREFGYRNKAEFDHDKPVWDGGENRESNLRARCDVPCHQDKTNTEAKQRAEAKSRYKARVLKKKKSKRYVRPMPGTKASGWKHKLNGQWVRR